MTPQQWARVVPQAPVRLTIPTIVRLAQEVVAAEEIIWRYYQTGTRLQLTDAQQAELRRAGVDRRVIDYILSAEQDAQRIDAITAQADQDARTRMAMVSACFYVCGWGPGWHTPYWGPRFHPFGGYAWLPDGSVWYGGIGIGF